MGGGARSQEAGATRRAGRADRRVRAGLGLLLAASLALLIGGVLEIASIYRGTLTGIARTNSTLAHGMAAVASHLLEEHEVSATNETLESVWLDLTGADASAPSYCLVDEGGEVSAHSARPGFVGADARSMMIVAPDGERTLAELLVAGVGASGRAETVDGQAQIVGVAPMPGGGAVIVHTSQRLARSAVLSAAISWIALTGLAALVLTPLSALLLLNAYQGVRRQSTRRIAELDALFESDAFGVAILDRELRYLRINRRLAEIDGYEVEEMIGRTVNERAPHVAERVGPIIEGVFASGEANTRVAVRLPDGAGGVRVFNANYHPLIGAGGAVEAVAVVVVEITELERAEGARKATEHVYRTIVETAREGVWMLDSEDRTTFVNDRMLEILGVAREDILDRPAVEAFPEESREFLMRTLERRHAGVGEEFSIRFEQTGGREVVARISLAPLVDDEGGYAGAVALVTDMTDTRETERLLELSEERFRALVGAQGEFVARWRPDGVLLFANEAYCRHLGVTAEDIVGSSFFPKIPAPDLSALRRQMTAVTPAEPSYTVEHRSVAPDGEMRWQQWTDRAVFNQRGELVEFVSVGRDITALKRAEERLRERERILASQAQRFSDFGSWRWAVEENRSYWSAGQHRLFGLAPDSHEPTLEGWLALVHPDDRQRTRDEIFDALRNPRPRLVEYRAVRTDGEVRTIQSSFEVIVGADGRATELLGTSIDMTERRLAQRLQQARTTALEQIAAGADIEQTLDTIVGTIESLVPGAKATVLRLEEGALRVARAPNMPAAYVGGFDGVRPSATVGSCGTAILEARRVIVEDVAEHPNWDAIRAQTQAANIRASWSEPIHGRDGEVLGALTLSFHESRRPTDDDLETMRVTTQLIGIAISRLRDEAALDESEERFRRLAESIDAVFWFAEGPPLEVHYVSPAFETVWGRQPEAIYKHAWLWNDSIHDADRQRVRDEFTAWLEGRRPEGYSQEYRIVRPDGAVRWIRDNGAILPGGRHGRRRIAGLAEDITVRKEGELLLQRLNEELARQRNTLRTTLGASTDLVFLYDADGGFSYLNPAALRLFGMTMDELRGRRVEELGVQHDIIADFVERRTRVLREGVAEHGESQFPVNGELREFDYVINPVFDARGGVAGAVASARDVTDQRRSSERLRLALQQLNFHVSNTPLAIVEWDSEFRVRRWSRRAEEMFGWTAAEVEGRPWAEWFIHPDDKERVAAIAQRLLDREDERNLSANRNLTKDGRVVHCEWYNSVLFDRDGGLVSVLSLAHDITDRVRAEEALRESEERLRLALEASTDGIWDWNIDADHLQWSDRVFEIFGLDPAEGSPSLEQLQRLIHPDDLDRWTCALENHLERREPFDVEYRIVRSEDSAWVRAVGQAVRDTVGRPVRMVGSMRDITERRAASEALRRAKEQLEHRVAERTHELVEAHDATARSEARFRSIFENSGVGVVLVDRAGALVEANPAFERMVRCAQAAARSNGSPCGVEAWSRVLAACPALDRVFRAAQPSLQDEVQVRTDGAESLWLRLTAQSLVGDDGAEDAAVVIVEDVTERRRAEEIAKTRQNELAHAARLITVGELAAGLAHELNQPLAAISAYADGCARRLAPDRGDQETMALLDKISGQARRAGSIIHRLKDLVRKQAPRREQCRLDVLLQETIELVAPTADARGVSISMRVPPDLPLVEADWVQLQQVFLNLLTNALEAVSEEADDGRSIRIEANCEPGAGVVRVTVEDSGPGLRGVNPEQLFESFYSTKSKGMGLGLPISRSIAEAHGGRLWCEPGTSHGARFVLMIPCVRGEVAANG